jgi:hypothetical protein
MTAAARRWSWLIALALAWLSSAGCRRGGPIATAIEVAGIVERGRGDAWDAAASGTAFVVGDALRTGAASRARLALTGGGVIRVGDNALLRFQHGTLAGRPGPALTVELGTAEVEETASDVSILTAIGTARVERGARVRVRADGEGARLEVLVGRAVMLAEGREVAVEAGHGVRILIGSTAVQRFSLEVGDAVVEQAATNAATDAGAPLAAAAPPPEVDVSNGTDGRPTNRADNGRVEGGRAGHADGARADVTVTAGESAALHDGRSSIAVRLRVDRLCTGEAIVELSGAGRRRERVTGADAVLLRLKPGRRAYTVRCAADGDRGAPRASGALTLRRDTGFVPLARRAPVVVIDADGRRYTVLFQTRLPQLTLSWPSAPATASLALHVEAGGERVIAGANPRRPLPAGTVQEGTYVLWYEMPDGKQSPKTTVNVRFDNAAPTAQFFRTAGAGTTSKAIAIDGVTVDGAKVSVGGQALAVDGNGRFRTEASPLDGDDAVAVRLEHPRTGIHYYVRRAARR